MGRGLKGIYIVVMCGFPFAAAWASMQPSGVLTFPQGRRQGRAHRTQALPPLTLTYIFSQLVTFGCHTRQVKASLDRAGGTKGEDHEAGLHISSQAA